MDNRGLSTAEAFEEPTPKRREHAQHAVPEKDRERETVQGILGHARIQTTLDLYTDEDLEEMIAAQEKFLNAVGFESGSVQ